MDEEDLYNSAGLLNVGSKQRVASDGASTKIVESTMSEEGIVMSPQQQKIIEIVEVMLKSEMSSQQQIRVLRSACLKVSMWNKSSELITKLKESTTEWFDRAQGIEKKHRQETLWQLASD